MVTTLRGNDLYENRMVKDENTSQFTNKCW